MASSCYTTYIVAGATIHIANLVNNSCHPQQGAPPPGKYQSYMFPHEYLSLPLDSVLIPRSETGADQVIPDLATYQILSHLRISLEGQL